MQGLTFNQVCQIERLVESEQIAFSHLADDLIDHICCMIEAECASGLSFDEAFRKARLEIGDTRNIKKVEEDTLLLIDKKYRNMKTIMKIFALISLIPIAFGAVFKMMHWPGAGILLLLGFTLLAFVFYPAAISVMKREHKIKGGRLIYPVALISGMALMTGVLFKIQHYPGASYLLLTGFALFMFVLIPALLISKTSTAAGTNIKRTNMLGAVALIIILAGVCSKFFHWPGAAVELFIGSLTLSLVWLPLHTYYSFKESTFVKGGFIYLCTAVILFNLFNMLLALNVSKEVAKDFIQPAITYNTGADAFFEYNQHSISETMTGPVTDSTLVRNVGEINLKTATIIGSLNTEKVKLISLIDDIPEKEASALMNKHYQLRNKFNFDIPTAYLYGMNETGKDGAGYAIQQKIEEYRNMLLELVDDPAEAAFINSLLSTSDVENIYSGEKTPWVQYYFYKVPDLGVLNTLSGLKYKILLAENSVILHLINQSNKTNK